MPEGIGPNYCPPAPLPLTTTPISVSTGGTSCYQALYIPSVKNPETKCQTNDLCHAIFSSINKIRSHVPEATDKQIAKLLA